MTPDEVLAALSVDHSMAPRIAPSPRRPTRDALVEPLLHAIEVGLADPENTPELQAILRSRRPHYR